MMKVLVVLTLVAVAYCADPKPCCMSNKYSGQMMQFGARKPADADAEILDNTFMIDYDYDAKKILLKGEARDVNTGMYHNLTVLEDFSVGKIYTQYDSFCTVSQVPMDSMTPPCVPANFMYDGAFTLGAGTNSLTIQSWSGTTGATDMRITLTSDCVPVTMYQLGNERGSNSTGILYSFAFAGVMQGQLSSADPFQVPDACKTAHQTVG